MTTYSKETALYNTGAIATDIDTAGTSATNYFTDISSGGVFVHEQDSTNPQPESSGSNGVKITNQVDIIRNGESVSSYGEGIRIGKFESGNSNITINAASNEETDISDILQIKTYNDVIAQRIVLDSSTTGSLRTFKEYWITPGVRTVNEIPEPDDCEYYMDGIGSSSDPLTTTARSKSETFTVPDISSIPEGIEFIFVTYTSFKSTKTTHANVWNHGSEHLFIKESSGSVQSSTNTYAINIQSFITGATINVTEELSYNPNNNQIIVTITAKLSGTPSPNYSYWIPNSIISNLTYILDDVKIPINQFNGDVYVCNALDVINNYSPVGRFYIGLDYETQTDLDLYNALGSYYNVYPLPVIKNKSLDIKKALIDIYKNITVFGTIETHIPSAISCADKKYYQVAYLTLDPGTWIISGSARFQQSNTTGIRRVLFTNDTSNYNNVTTQPSSLGNIWYQTFNGSAFPANGSADVKTTSAPVNVTTEKPTIRLIAYQSSGSAMNVTGRFYAIRIK